MAGLVQTVAPSEEPVTLAEARTHLRMPAGDTTQDALISSLIVAARLHAEAVTARRFVTQTWKLTLDDFPRGGRLAPVYGNLPPLPQYIAYPFRPDRDAIVLPYPPLASVTSIKYYDAAGVQQTISPSDYIVDTASEPARIVPAVGVDWPTPQFRINAVEIVFVAGYGAATAVPEGLKSWIKLRVGATYENREELVVGTRVTSVDLPFVDGLLDPYRVLTA